jgi:hypothetical protein
MTARSLFTVLVTVAVLCLGGAAWGAIISFTTIPDNSGFNTVSGTNTDSNACSFAVGGHITYTKTARTGYPPTYFDYAYTRHDATSCGNTNCTTSTGDCMSPAAYFKVAVVSGAGSTVFDANIDITYDMRVYDMTNVPASLMGHAYANGFATTLFNNSDVVEDWWAGPSGGGSIHDLQYKVGAWTGTGGWASSAATPYL